MCGSKRCWCCIKEINWHLQRTGHMIGHFLCLSFAGYCIYWFIKYRIAIQIVNKHCNNNVLSYEARPIHQNSQIWISVNALSYMRWNQSIKTSVTYFISSFQYLYILKLKPNRWDWKGNRRRKTIGLRIARIE